ncbi:glycosyl hydrolase family 18 protein [Geothrix sp. PMB-07]|uniref:glycosyl hydrolase family 18 protein n=1 Tax=Geothrix sp. PMB-07 TaxID=3068640 RepID=UPI00274175C1|nr:glycosyl hydrolase family 18 protein [Geothrix sp. PMB-07]WLT32376.1 glycosyl hydrolase family 18 protein [Geothrix sp. PMB-07]
MKRFIQSLVCCVLGWGALIHCGGGGGKSSPASGGTNPPATNAPAIVSFSASPANITAGASSTLSWTVSGATSLSIDHGAPAASGATGTVSVSPAATTTYTLTATNGGGSVTAATTVTVAGTSAVSVTINPSTATVQATKTQAFTATVTGSTNTAVTWSVQEASGGAVDATGLYTAPATPGTYHVVATSVADTSQKATATVTVATVVAKVVSTPAFSLGGGTYGTAQTVAISTLTAGAAIFYTTDGSAPSAASTRYTTPLAVSQTTTLKAIATLAGWTDSAVASATFTIQPGTAAPKPWVTCYAAAWDFGKGDYISPEGVDYKAMTHFVLCYTLAGGYPGTKTPQGQIEGIPSIMRGVYGSTAQPYTTKQGRTYPSAEEAYVGEAHRAGAKALSMIGGSGDNTGMLNAAQDDTHRPVLIKAIVDRLVLADYDGIDIDWENHLPSDWSVVARFLSDLRTEANKRPRYQAPHAPVLITWPGYTLYRGWDNSSNIAGAVALAPYLDQYNLMTYDLVGNGNWDLTWGYNNIHNSANWGRHPTDLEFTMNGYVNGGVPKSKLGIGLGFYTTAYPSFAPWAPGKAYQQHQKVVSGYGVYIANQAGTSGTGSAPSGFGSDIPDGAITWAYVGSMGPDQPTATASGLAEGDASDRQNGTVVTYANEGTRLFDADTGNSYIVFKDDPKARGYITWEDERSIAEKAQWVRTQGYGGTIIWTGTYGNVGTGAYDNPFMDAVKRCFLGDAIPIHLKVAPNPVALSIGQAQAFTVSEITGTDNKGVTWSVVEAGGGTVTQGGAYTAPTQPGVYHVRATSQADTTIYADVTVTVDGFRVTVNPPNAKVPMGQTQAFAPVFVNGSGPKGVTWSVVEAGSGSVNASGLYTAPNTPGTYHVRATSVDNPTVRGVGEVLVPAPVAVTISPANGKVAPGQSLRLWGSVTGDGIGDADKQVTWKVQEAGGGSVASATYPVGTYTAPATPGTYHVTATSVKDATKSVTVPVQVVTSAPVATVSPFTALPAHPSLPSLSGPTVGTRMLKDRTTGSAGELFAFVQTDKLHLLKSGDLGATWSYVDADNGETLGHGVLAMTQDSTGKAHLMYRVDNRVRYARVALTHTGGAITGFHSEVKDIILADRIDPFLGVGGTMQAVTDGAGAERLVYQFCSKEDGQDRAFCLRMGQATSLTPAAPGDFVGLDGAPGMTTVFETGVFSIGGHSATFAQLGATKDLWAAIGPNEDAVEIYDDGTGNMLIHLSTVAGTHTWTWGQPSNVDQPSSGTRPCLFSLVGAANHVWFMRSDPELGVCFDTIAADGTYVHDAIPSPERFNRRGGSGVFSVSADETSVSAIWVTRPRDGNNSKVPGQLATQGFWDGSAWSFFTDDLSGLPGRPLQGLFCSSGWSDGAVALHVSTASGNPLGVSTVRKN